MQELAFSGQDQSRKVYLELDSKISGILAAMDKIYFDQDNINGFIQKQKPKLAQFEAKFNMI